MTGGGNPNPDELALVPPHEALSLVTDSTAAGIGAALLAGERAAGEVAADPGATAAYLDGRALFLLASADRTPIETYAGYGLRVGARRMDLVQGGNLHETTLESLLVDQRVQGRLLDGRQTIMGSAQPRSGAVRGLIERMKQHVSFHLTEPTLIHGVIGQVFNRTGDAHIRTSRPFLAPAVLQTMKSEGWSESLQTLAIALAMQSLAMRKIRAEVNAGLRRHDLLSRAMPGREDDYWEAKLLGNEEQEGIFYYLGYVDKSRAVLRRHMLGMWEPDQYERNRQVLISALSLRTYNVPGRGAERTARVKMLREALFAEIGRGDFAAAENRMRLLARINPKLFPPLSYDYFKPDGAPVAHDLFAVEAEEDDPARSSGATE